jgi:hypothetical protein
MGWNKQERKEEKGKKKKISKGIMKENRKRKRMLSFGARD